MTKAIIIRGKDRHTYRLEQSLSMCQIEYKTAKDYRDIPREQYDIAFIDPSTDFNPFPKLTADIKVFYDCEDGPKDFTAGLAYHELKHKIEFYAKMNWVDDDRGDGIQNIGFPLTACAKVQAYAEHIDNTPAFTEFKPYDAIPIFFGAPTYLGSYTPGRGTYGINKELDVSALGVYDDGDYIYNQRFDWLQSLHKNNIPYFGGIVYGKDNLSLEWQQKYHGKGVELFKSARYNSDDYMKALLLTHKIGLCPAGHDRLSWRMFDIMATGAILIWTDTKKQKSLYMPKEYVTIKDGEDLGTTLLSLQPSYKEIWKACQENKKIFIGLTPDKMWKDFMRQLK